MDTGVRSLQTNTSVPTESSTVVTSIQPTVVGIEAIGSVPSSETIQSWLTVSLTSSTTHEPTSATELESVSAKTVVMSTGALESASPLKSASWLLTGVLLGSRPITLIRSPSRGKSAGKPTESGLVRSK